MLRNDGFTVIQITDTHLFSDKKAELLGHCTFHRLERIVDHIVRLQPAADCVLVTGDISQDETVASYQLALRQFERFHCPVYWIHGNHDHLDVVHPIFSMSAKLQQLHTLETPHWDLISIDTCRHGTDDGYIDDDEFRRFVSRVETSQKNNKRIAVVMHHHPWPVKTPLLDECMLKNGAAWMQFVTATEEIELLICGHVHGEYSIRRCGLTMETCPATCFQWARGTSKVKTDDAQGYKLFTFHRDSYSSSCVYI